MYIKGILNDVRYLSHDDLMTYINKKFDAVFESIKRIQITFSLHGEELNAYFLFVDYILMCVAADGNIDDQEYELFNRLLTVMGIEVIEKSSVEKIAAEIYDNMDQATARLDTLASFIIMASDKDEYENSLLGLTAGIFKLDGNITDQELELLNYLNQTFEKYDGNAFDYRTDENKYVSSETKAISDAIAYNSSLLEKYDNDDIKISYNNNNYSEEKITEDIIDCDSYYLNHTDITGVIVPRKVKAIDDEAFLGCTGLKSFIMPDSIERIGKYAFKDCKALNNLVIPGSVATLGSHVFDNCTRLETVVLQEGLMEIGMGAFTDCTSLREIKIPSTLNAISEYTFDYCDNLVKVDIEEGVEEISFAAFEACRALEAIELPNSIKAIDEYAFYKCEKLKEISIPNKVRAISKYMFLDCKGLEGIIIPASVKKIEKDAFKGCSKLKNVYYTGDEEKWKKIKIAGGNKIISKANIEFNYTINE